MSLADYIPENFIEQFSNPDFQKALKGFSMYLIKEDEEYREQMKCYIDECSVTSDLEIVPRLIAVEKVTGIRETSEKHEPNLPERIEVLEDKIDHITVRTIEIPVIEQKTIPTTTLDLKAEAIVEHLQKDVKQNWGKEIVMNAKDIYTFFTEKVKDSLRWPADLKNKRQTKLEIIERAVKMYPDVVEIRTDMSGNKTKGIALKASAKCRHTDTC